MARFPKSEAETLLLIQEMINGFANHMSIYPEPPVIPAALSGVMSGYLVARNNATEAEAEAQQTTTDKNEALQIMIDEMKQDLRYAENTVNYDDDKLKLIGWAGRSKKVPLQKPGQTRSLEAPREGEGWVYLDWKQPIEGGAVASYKVERRERPAGCPWLTADLAIETEITLIDQERGKEFEYRVIAINKAGKGKPSNTVMAVM